MLPCGSGGRLGRQPGSNPGKADSTADCQADIQQHALPERVSESRPASPLSVCIRILPRTAASFYLARSCAQLSSTFAHQPGDDGLWDICKNRMWCWGVVLPNSQIACDECLQREYQMHVPGDTGHTPKGFLPWALCSRDPSAWWRRFAPSTTFTMPVSAAARIVLHALLLLHCTLLSVGAPRVWTVGRFEERSFGDDCTLANRIYTNAAFAGSIHCGHAAGMLAISIVLRFSMLKCCPREQILYETMPELYAGFRRVSFWLE